MAIYQAVIHYDCEVVWQNPCIYGQMLFQTLTRFDTHIKRYDMIERV